VTYKGGIPHDREALCAGLRERRIPSINEGVIDASKRHTQAALSQLGLPTTEAAAEDDPEERLFFKSNYNFGGVAERRLSQQVRDYFGIRLPHRATPLFRNCNVYRRNQLKPEAFGTEDVFFERFVDNRQHAFFRAFKLDMGGVDVLLDDEGTPYIIDANPTAYGGEILKRPGIRQHLVDGLLQQAKKTASLVD
jgi:hypothetical protein